MLLLFIILVSALPLPNEYNVSEAALIAAGAGTVAGVSAGIPLAIGANKLFDALAHNPKYKKISVPYAAAREGVRIGVAGGAGVAVGTLVANQLQTKSNIERNAVGGMAGGAMGVAVSLADSGPRAMLAGAVGGAVVGGIAGLVATA